MLFSLTNLYCFRLKKPESSGDEQADIDYRGNLSLAQHLLLGSSGLAHQFCKLTNLPKCNLVPEYQALVDAISARVNVRQ